MLSRRIFVLTFVLLVLLVHWVCISEADSKKANCIWKMATLAPDEVGWAVYLKKNFSPAIEKVTNGDVAIDWYWGGIMGDDEDYIAKIRIDQLQGAGFSASGIVMACPPIIVLELPFLFNDFDEVSYVITKMRQRINSIFQANGFKALMVVDQDFDQIYSTKREIRTPEDFAKTKFVTWIGRVESDTLQSLGTSPIPINVPEINSSIRSGICDGLIAPAIWYVGSQLYTMTKYVSHPKLRYSPGGVIISMQAWNRTPEKYHKALDEMMPKFESGLNEYSHNSNKKCLRAMIEYGMKEVKLMQAEKEVWKKKTRPVWDQLAGKVYQRELLDEVLGYLEEYRSNKKFQ